MMPPSLTRPFYPEPTVNFPHVTAHFSSGAYLTNFGVLELSWYL